VLADPRAQPRCGYRAGAGLVAALEGTEGRSTWIVSGTDGAGVRHAARALDPQDLRDRYAVAIPPHGASLGVPVAAARERAPCRGEEPR